ncbi:MAG: alpha-glucan family phosphorylase [Fuerstiella sp.]
MKNGYLFRELPEKLRALTDLALDLRWAGSPVARRIWHCLEPYIWARTENPFLTLMNVDSEALEVAGCDQELMREMSRVKQLIERCHASQSWFEQHVPPQALTRVAYFSMEFGLSEALPIYSGGLGILAGDHLKSASDLGIPLVGIGLLYQQGYFRQVLSDDGYQLEAFPYNDPNCLPVTPVLRDDGDVCRVLLPLPGRTLRLRIWQARVGRVTLYLLDSNDPLNSPWDRGITTNLYAAGSDKRLLQEIVLGLGGWEVLRSLGLNVDVCHLNEGHPAFAVLARAADYAERHRVSAAVALRATRAGNVFTTHTPVPAAFDIFDPDLVAHFAEPFLLNSGVDVNRVLALGRRDPGRQSAGFNMAYLALHGSAWVNGVSRLHGRVSQKLFSPLFPRWPEREVPVGAITNGVDFETWSSLSARQLWCGEEDQPLTDLESTAHRIEQADAVDLWRFRAEARLTLVEYVRQRLMYQLRVRGASSAEVRQAGHVLEPNTLTLGFARRFTEYKRPNLLLHDVERLKRLLLNQDRPVQLIVAGKAHPNDDQGKLMVQAMARFAMQPELRMRVVFLEDYDMVLGRHLAAGVDVWLNNPRRPAEACGTSGMKILFNGGLNLSVPDGWWDEAYVPEVGWSIGSGEEDAAAVRDAREADLMLTLLEREIVPEFYDRTADGVPLQWLKRVRSSMATLAPRFSSNRMVRDYVQQAYVPAAKALQRRTERHSALAIRLCEWKRAVDENWQRIHFGDVYITDSDGHWHFDVQAYLSELSVDDVRVELYAESPAGDPVLTTMECGGAIPGAINGFVFRTTVPGDRPAADFTPRIVPNHPDAFVPLEVPRILWLDRDTHPALRS